MVEGNLLLGAVAGLVGTAIMTILMYAAKLTGLKLDLPYLLGSRFAGLDNKSKTYTIGFLLHFLLGAAWGAFYVLTITAMAFTPNWATGILWGFAHGIFIGVVMSTMSKTHPHIGEGKEIDSPGILGRRWSPAMPYLVLGLHIIFGVTTLVTYQMIFNL